MKRFVSLQFLNPKTAGRIPWMGDQPIARPLTNTNTDIPSFSGIRTHDSSIRAGETVHALHRRGHYDRPVRLIYQNNSLKVDSHLPEDTQYLHYIGH
jgi:hypothetical protein